MKEKTMSASDQNPAARLAQLEREYAELTASLPAHSVPASHLMRLEALEDEIAALRSTLDLQNGREDPPAGKLPK
jgi:hypothetical protein